MECFTGVLVELKASNIYPIWDNYIKGGQDEEETHISILFFSAWCEDLNIGKCEIRYYLCFRYKIAILVYHFATIQP